MATSAHLSAPREAGPRLGREAGVLAPHVPTPDAPVAAHPDEQRRGTPTHRLVRQRPGDGVARHALTPAPSAPAVVLHDAAGQHRPIRLQSLADDFQAEVIETSERGQVRASEGSVRHVEVFRMGGVRTSIIGRPRPLSNERRADAYAHVYAATSTPWIRKSPLTPRSEAMARISARSAVVTRPSSTASRASARTNPRFAAATSVAVREYCSTSSDSASRSCSEKLAVLEGLDHRFQVRE